MQVDVGVRAVEHAVLVPVRLPDGRPIADRLQGGRYAGSSTESAYHQDDVGDRLRRQTGHRRGADVLDPRRPVAERGLDPVGFALEQPRPVLVVVDQDHRAGQLRRVAADPDRGHLLVGVLRRLGRLAAACLSSPSARPESRP